MEGNKLNNTSKMSVVIVVIGVLLLLVALSAVLLAVFLPGPVGIQGNTGFTGDTGDNAPGVYPKLTSVSTDAISIQSTGVSYLYTPVFAGGTSGNPVPITLDNIPGYLTITNSTGKDFYCSYLKQVIKIEIGNVLSFWNYKDGAFYQPLLLP